MVELLADQRVVLQAGNSETRLLILQGKPIAEPVTQYGPFVMNTQAEISQAISDFRATQLEAGPGEKPTTYIREPWPLCKYKDGKEEKP
jgi:quercetin 2,3-dioxygenase